MCWNKRIVIAVVTICSFLWHSALATNANSLIKQEFAGWKVYQQIAGDLTGDRKPDVAAILYKPAADKNEDSQALIVIYLNDGKGGYQLNTRATKAICVGCGGPKAAVGEPFGVLSIEKGQLHVFYQGSRPDSSFLDELTWRFDKTKKEFFLIEEWYGSWDLSKDLRNIPKGPVFIIPEVMPLNASIGINYLTQKTDLSEHGNVPSAFKAMTLVDFDYKNDYVAKIWKAIASENNNFYLAELVKLKEEELQLEAKGEFEKAIDINYKILECNPKIWETMNTIASLNGKLGRFEEQARWAGKAWDTKWEWEEARGIKPTGYPEACINLGNAYASQREFNEALSWYKQSVEVDPQFEKGYFGMATMYVNLKQYNEAIASLKKVLELNNNSEDAKQMLTKVENLNIH